MEYQGVASQNYYNYPEVQLAHASYGYKNYFASNMNSHVGVASHNSNRHVASANYYVNNDPHHAHPGYYGEEPMSTLNSSSSNFTSNIQHAYPYSSAISS